MLISVIITTGVFIFLAIIVFFVIVFNNLQSVKNNVNKAESNIKVLLKQRFDEIPQLIEVCRTYIDYENNTLKELTKLRKDFNDEIDKEKKTNEDELVYVTELDDLDKKLTKQMQDLKAVSESYPDLRASEQFIHLQLRISTLEDQISDRREFFNDSVNVYNTRLDSLPDLFIARLLNYKKKEMFTIDENEKNISADFNKILSQ